MKDSQTLSVDYLLEHNLGWRGFGLAQALTLLVGGLAYASTSLVMFQMTFTYTNPLVGDGPPVWRCAQPSDTACTALLRRQEYLPSATPSQSVDSPLDSSRNSSHDSEDYPSTIGFCDLAPSQFVWLRPETSLSSEYNLVCSQAWKASLLETLFFAGFMTGNGIFGAVADRHGRRLTLAACTAATAALTALSASPLVPPGPGVRAAASAAVVSSLANRPLTSTTDPPTHPSTDPPTVNGAGAGASNLPFVNSTTNREPGLGQSSNSSSSSSGGGGSNSETLSSAIEGGSDAGFWIHLVLRCAAGALCAGQSLGAYVLATELVGPAWRGAAGMLTQTFYIFGEFLLVALSLAWPPWRQLTLVVALTGVVVLLLLPAVPESPRWLLLQGRTEKAHAALLWVARLNGVRPLPRLRCTKEGEVYLLQLTEQLTEQQPLLPKPQPQLKSDLSRDHSEQQSGRSWGLTACDHNSSGASALPQVTEGASSLRKSCIEGGGEATTTGGGGKLSGGGDVGRDGGPFGSTVVGGDGSGVVGDATGESDGNVSTAAAIICILTDEERQHKVEERKGGAVAGVGGEVRDEVTAFHKATWGPVLGPGVASGRPAGGGGWSGGGDEDEEKVAWSVEATPRVPDTNGQHITVSTPIITTPSTSSCNSRRHSSERSSSSGVGVCGRTSSAGGATATTAGTPGEMGTGWGCQSSSRTHTCSLSLESRTPKSSGDGGGGGCGRYSGGGCGGYGCRHSKSMTPLICTNGQNEEELRLLGIATTSSDTRSLFPLPTTSPPAVTSAADSNDCANGTSPTTSAPSSTTLFTALSHPPTRSLLLSACFVMCALSVAYFGVTLALGSLAGSLHTNFALTAAAELPGYLAIAAFIDRLGRRAVIGGGTALAGVACLGCAAVGGAGQVVFAMAGKLGCSGAWAVGLTFAAELFPTCMRSAALSVASQSGDLGGLLAPLLLLAAPTHGPFQRLPFAVMGLLSLAAVGLVLRLPETRGIPQLDTFEQLMDWMEASRRHDGRQEAAAADTDPLLPCTTENNSSGVTGGGGGGGGKLKAGVEMEVGVEGGGMRGAAAPWGGRDVAATAGPARAASLELVDLEQQ